MKTTRYFDEQVLRKRTYPTIEMCAVAAADHIRREVQADGRMRMWGEVYLPGEPEARIPRVVTLEDGETLPNAFLNRGFRKGERWSCFIIRRPTACTSS